MLYIWFAARFCRGQAVLPISVRQFISIISIIISTIIISSSISSSSSSSSSRRRRIISHLFPISVRPIFKLRIYNLGIWVKQILKQRSWAFLVHRLIA